MPRVKGAPHPALRATFSPLRGEKAGLKLDIRDDGSHCFCGSDASREAGNFAATASIAILLGFIHGIFLIASIVLMHALRVSRLASLPHRATADPSTGCARVRDDREGLVEA